MPRIRSLKPEIWQDEALGACPRDARLLFVGLITQADDAGRFRAAPALLRASIFPYDESLTKSRVEGWLLALGEAGLVILYTVKGERYGEFPTWGNHQKIDRPSESKIPGFTAPDAVPLNESTKDRRALDESSPLEGRGEEGKGKDRESTFDQIYQQWMNEPGLVTHRRPTPAMRRAATKCLADYDLDQILQAITLYATVLASTKHWFTYSWSLEEFLKRGVGKFVPEVQPLTRYYGAQPGSNGNGAHPPADRDPAAAHHRDVERCRGIYDAALAQGMSEPEARTEAAGTYPDLVVAKAIGKSA